MSGHSKPPGWKAAALRKTSSSNSGCSYPLISPADGIGRNNRARRWRMGEPPATISKREIILSGQNHVKNRKRGNLLKHDRLFLRLSAGMLTPEIASLLSATYDRAIMSSL